MDLSNLNFSNTEVSTLSPQETDINISNLISGRTNVLDPNWTTAYSELERHLRTGDIVLVHGRYPFSWVVELLQWSSWGHSAMVVLAKDLDPENHFGLPPIMLWESNTGNQEIPNRWPALGPVKEGPMLIDLKDRLQHSQGSYKDVQIVHRPLFNCPDIDGRGLQDFFTSQINKGFPSDKEVIFSVYMGRKYNRSTSSAIGGMFFIFNSFTGDFTEMLADSPGMQPAVDMDPNKIYCSELVAATYKQMGLLTKTWVNNAYSPKDFSAEGTMRLLNRAYLGEQMYINMFQ